MHQRYSRDGFNELLYLIGSATDRIGCDVTSDTFPSDDEYGEIVANLFEFAQNRRNKLNEIYGQEYLAEIMKTKRDSFVTQFPTQQLLKWAEKNRDKAEQLELDAVERAKQYNIDPTKVYDGLNAIRLDMATKYDRGSIDLL